MVTSIRGPAIACIALIGKQLDPLEFSFLLSSCLDIFEARLPYKTAEQDFGLLHAVDERLAMYGWLTNTGIKIIIAVDMAARLMKLDAKDNPIIAVRESDLKPAFRAVQAAYITLLRNPFYMPDEPMAPASTDSAQTSISTSAQITSPKFIAQIKQIADTWTPS